MNLLEWKKEAQGETLANIAYLEKMCRILDIDPKTVERQHFPEINDCSKQRLNQILTATSKILAPKQPVFETLPDDVQTAISLAQTTLLQNSIANLRTLRRQHLDYLRNADQYLNEHNTQLQHAVAAYRSVKQLEAIIANPGAFVLKELFEDPFFKFNSVSKTAFDFSTPRVVITTKIGAEEKSVDMGIYRIALDLASGNLRVLRRSRNLLVSDYYHPYISQSGQICWGNASEIIRSLRMCGDYVKIFQYLKTILTTYSWDSTPYCGLDRFIAAAEAREQENERRKKAGLRSLEEEENAPEPTDDLCEYCGNDDCDCLSCDHCGHATSPDNICSACECCDNCGHTEDCENN